eukprot:1160489-Pelagomonas_calceolata.AAC.6
MSAPICPVHMCKAKRPVASIRHSPDHQVALVHTELRPAPVPHKESSSRTQETVERGEHSASLSPTCKAPLGQSMLPCCAQQLHTHHPGELSNPHPRRMKVKSTKVNIKPVCVLHADEMF